jgi:hypothetical protein
MPDFSARLAPMLSAKLGAPGSPDHPDQIIVLWNQTPMQSLAKQEAYDGI